MSFPAQYPLRPTVDVGHVLTRTWQLVRANLKLLVGIAAVPPVVVYGLLGVLAAAVLIPLFSRLHEAPSPQLIEKVLLVIAPLVILTLVLYWLVFALSLAAGSHAAIQVDCGVQAGFGDSYAAAWSRAGRYFALLLIIYAICFFPAIAIQLAMVASIGVAALNRTQPNPLIFVMFPVAGFLQMALLVAGFVFALRFSLAFPAAVAENLATVPALRRSGVLTRGIRLRVFLVLLVIYAATYIAMLILMCGAGVLAAVVVLALSGTHVALASPLAVSLGVLAALGFMALMALFMACSWAGFTAALCVIYNDRRRCLDTVETSGAPAWGR